MATPKSDIELVENILRCFALWEASFEDFGLYTIQLFGSDFHFHDLKIEIDRLPEPMRSAVRSVYVDDLTASDAIKSGLREDADKGVKMLFEKLEASLLDDNSGPSW